MIEPVLPLNLALVIPVWNDAAGLAQLLGQARGRFAQIVVVDDGSDIAVVAPGCTVLRHDTSQGAGVARNAGLAVVTTDYVLFFDADDALTAELDVVCADLAEGCAFDVCLFNHADSRAMSEPRWGQTDWDHRLWMQAGVACGALQETTQAPLLAQTTNYPWNKIYRTAFLRDHSIQCATTRLHEDMALHWGALAHADRLLVSDRVCVIHHVSQTGTRQTNLMGTERLEVFDALLPVVQIVADKGPIWQAALARYVLVLIDWIGSRIDPAHLEALRQAEQVWLRDTFAGWLQDIAKTDPIAAQSLQKRLA